MIFIILLKISNLQNILGVKKARRNGLVADRGSFFGSYKLLIFNDLLKP